MGTLDMEYCNLYPKLISLNIFTGKLGSNEISAWHDTRDTSTLDFLHWFEETINNDNILRGSEILGYEELTTRNLILTDSKYEQAMQELFLEYDDICDIETNQFKCKNFAGELQFENEEHELLQSSIAQCRDIIKDLKKQKQNLSNQISNTTFRQNELAVGCIAISEKLDQINADIGIQMTNCSKILNASMCSPVFMPDFDIKKHNDYVADINIDMVQICEADTIPFSRSQCNGMDSDDMDLTLGNNISNPVHFDLLVKQLEEILCQRVNKSVRNAILKKQLKMSTEMHSYNTSNVSRIHHDSLNSTYSAVNDIRLRISNTMHDTVMKFIESPNVAYSQKELADLKIKETFYQSLNEKLNEAVQYQNLLSSLFTCEKNAFDTLKASNKAINDYVINDLQQCELRVQVMKQHIREYKKYELMPFNEKWLVLRRIVEIIGGVLPITTNENGTTENGTSSLTLKESLTFIIKFNEQYKSLEQQLFSEDVERFTTSIKRIESSNKTLKQFLCSKTTSQLHVMPYDVYSALSTLNETMQKQAKYLKYSADANAEAKAKFRSNQWLRYKRQLWMYFLMKPEKMEQIILEIEDAIHEITASYFN